MKDVPKGQGSPQEDGGIRSYRLGDGLAAHPLRVLHGTNTSSWGGTRAYQTGIDVLVGVHCARCCCRWVMRLGTCGNPVVERFRVQYSSSDPDAWRRAARERADAHLARHAT